MYFFGTSDEQMPPWAARPLKPQINWGMGDVAPAHVVPARPLRDAGPLKFLARIPPPLLPTRTGVCFGMRAINRTTVTMQTH